MASIHKRSDGRWRVQYRDKAERKHPRNFEGKVHGQLWVEEVNARAPTGIHADLWASTIVAGFAVALRAAFVEPRDPDTKTRGAAAARSQPKLPTLRHGPGPMTARNNRRRADVRRRAFGRAHALSQVSPLAKPHRRGQWTAGGRYDHSGAW